MLDNWARIDKAAPLSLDNVRMVQNFAGGEDENWFVLIHIAIELEARVLLDCAARLIKASEAGEAAACEALLGEMEQA